MGHKDNEKVFPFHGPSKLHGALLGAGLKKGGGGRDKGVSEVQDLSF
jgi:hypothetical protein